MAVGLSGLPKLHPVAGIRLGACASGIRRRERLDLAVIECAPDTVAAAVFTQNQFPAAPVVVARRHLSFTAPRALVINTGYANAGTGTAGEQDAVACCAAVAGHLGCAPEAVLPFSTGVIGERFPVDRILAGLPVCLDALSENGWETAAAAIMTTDTIPKGGSRRVQVGGKEVTVTGIAKGAGMIYPNMATMLAFIATDAAASAHVLQRCVQTAVEESFNRISVDGGTSTNDACVLLATGRAGNNPIAISEGTDYTALLDAVRAVFIELAHAIVRDAEGATKFITIEVTQGPDIAECLEIAYAIAHSPLVKTAFFASDPNWGRVLAVVGQAARTRLDPRAVSIHINDVCVFTQGAKAPDYTEARGAMAMRGAEIKLRVELGNGSQQARVWTSDLSHDYVRINAEYRT